MRDQLPFFQKTWLHIGVKFFRSETEFPILFSATHRPTPTFLFCSAAADMSWSIIKRQAKKPLRIFPELRTYNCDVALWHSLCEKKVTELTIHIIFIVARTFLKYRENISGGWWSLSTESDSRKPESTIRRLIADRGKWKPFSLVVELVGQYIRELIWAQKDVHDVERKWKL